MSKARIIYIASLIVLGVLIVFTVFKPMTVGEGYSEVQREQLLETGDQYIIQFDIINHEGKAQNYTITVVVDGKPYSQEILICDDRKFSYIQHVYHDRITEGIVCFTICKDGEETPFEKATYYLK